jgi:processing peptidase subunit beta
VRTIFTPVSTLPPGYTVDPELYTRCPPTDVSTLANGMTVASEQSAAETATIGVFIDAGSRYETDESNGAAHFLEHMAFKGTTTRSRHQLEVEIENMGGHLNAYTSREMTVYYAKVFKQDVPKAVEILSDILKNSELQNHNIEQERDVILREMQEVMSNDEEVIFDYLHATAYQGTSMARTILGPADNVRKLERHHLVNYIESNYVASRMALVGAGAVNQQQLEELGNQHFGDLAKEGKGTSLRDQDVYFTGGTVNHRDDDLPLAHVAIAFEGLPWKHPDSFALMVMQSILGCWNRSSIMGANVASPMCQYLAENDLAHSVMSFNTTYTDTGLFGVYAVCEPDKLSDCTWTIQREMLHLCSRVTDEQVARAAAQLKANLLFQDGTTAVCEDIGRQLLVYGRRLPLAEVFARIDAVSAEQVKRVATEVIEDREVAAAGKGPTIEFPDYNKLRRGTYMLRF